MSKPNNLKMKDAALTKVICKSVKYYFSSAWLPGTIAICLLGLATCAVLYGFNDSLTSVLMAACCLAYLGIVIAAFTNLLGRRWIACIIHFLLLWYFPRYALFAVNMAMRHETAIEIRVATEAEE